MTIWHHLPSSEDSFLKHFVLMYDSLSSELPQGHNLQCKMRTSALNYLGLNQALNIALKQCHVRTVTFDFMMKFQVNVQGCEKVCHFARTSFQTQQLQVPEQPWVYWFHP